jgi:copper oxidase (laccase) domain-containing protein
MMKSAPVIFISSVKDGHMGVSAPKNRKKYFAKIGINPAKVVDVVVTHGNKIKEVSEKDGGKFFEGFDGIITKDTNLFLGLTCADCMPIAVFDPGGNSIGLLHCGWRGLENGVIGKTIRTMKNKWKIENGKLQIYIGPHICRKHYRMDISSIAKKQLLDSGVREKNITVDPRCTFEDKELFSYRRDRTKNRNLYLFG